MADTHNDIKLKIIKCLIKEDSPLILNHIAKKTKHSAQLVEYHIKRMLDQGVIICGCSEGKKYYYLSAPFYDEYKIDALYKYLTPYIETIITEMKDCNDGVVEYETAVFTLKYLLHLFIDDVSKEL